MILRDGGAKTNMSNTNIIEGNAFTCQKTYGYFVMHLKFFNSSLRLVFEVFFLFLLVDKFFYFLFLFVTFNS